MAPFVLLHPGHTDVRALEPLLDALGPGYRLITPEQRAHGHTPDAGELIYAAMANDTVAFIESLDVAPVHLLGLTLRPRCRSAEVPKRRSAEVPKCRTAYRPRHVYTCGIYWRWRL